MLAQPTRRGKQTPKPRVIRSSCDSPRFQNSIFILTRDCLAGPRLYTLPPSPAIGLQLGNLWRRLVLALETGERLHPGGAWFSSLGLKFSSISGRSNRFGAAELSDRPR